LKSLTSFEACCSLALGCRRLRSRDLRLLDFRALFPSKSWYLKFAVTPTQDPLLSWGSHLWGFPLRPCALSRVCSSSVLSDRWLFSRTACEPGTLESKLSEDRLDSLAESSYPSDVGCLLEASGLFGIRWSAGLSFSPSEDRRITTTSSTSLLAGPSNPC
jgi:hypothetical protein